MNEDVPIDPAHFRSVLSHYPTGVCVAASFDETGQPLGMVVGSFTSVSLDPPLIGFFPHKASTTWANISQTGMFCVSVLADDQAEVSRIISTGGESKFDKVPYLRSRRGLRPDTRSRQIGR